MVASSSMEDEFAEHRSSVQTRLLIRKLVELTGESEEQVVLRALEERVARLTGPVSKAERRQRVLNMLETSVWRFLPAGESGRTLTGDEHDKILGYGPEGV